MMGKKAFLTLLAFSAACALFPAGLHAQLIEPTRSLEGAPDAAGLLSVVSEPPGLEVRLDGTVIGKTPIFSAKFPLGTHKLRIRGSETDIQLTAGKTFTVSWFKGAFIEVPETAKPPAETAQGLPPAGAAPKPEEPPGSRPAVANDPYYWPLIPRGPIY